MATSYLVPHLYVPGWTVKTLCSRQGVRVGPRRVALCVERGWPAGRASPVSVCSAVCVFMGMPGSGCRSCVRGHTLLQSGSGQPTMCPGAWSQ